MGMNKWKGFDPPPMTKVKSPQGSNLRSPIGDYKLGRKTKSKKMRDVFG